jgi:hypothetical protein
MTTAPQAQITDRGSHQSERLFYVIAACAMLLLTAGGFRNFYLHGKAPWGEMTTQIVPLIVVHGLAMSSWVILFFVQSLLIWMGNRRLHTVIGPAGGVLAAAIVILGTSVAALSVHFNPKIYEVFGGPKLFLAIMLTQVLLFGTLVGIGVGYRRRAEIHRPMMLLATIVILSGALGRFPYTAEIATRSPLYVWGPVLLFGGLLILLQWGMTRLANRWYLIGYAGIVLACLVSVALGNTTLWNQMAGMIVR